MQVLNYDCSRRLRLADQQFVVAALCERENKDRNADAALLSALNELVGLTQANASGTGCAFSSWEDAARLQVRCLTGKKEDAAGADVCNGSDSDSGEDLMLLRALAAFAETALITEAGGYDGEVASRVEMAVLPTGLVTQALVDEGMLYGGNGITDSDSEARSLSL